MKPLAIVFASLVAALSIPATLEAQQDTMCTMQYDPVCGVIDGKQQTFGNSCTAGAAAATILYKGECSAGGGVSGSGTAGVYVPPASCTSWFDGCNTCSKQPDGSSACTLRACMGEPAPGYCISYDTQKPTPVSDPDRPVSFPGTSASANIGSDVGITAQPVAVAATTTVEAEVAADPGFVHRIWQTVSSWFVNLFR